MKKHLIVIAGPTASGKSRLAIDLAAEWGSVILSADSRQFYREMTIGTAKPEADELSTIHHYFINTLTIDQDYTAGDFERAALEILRDIFKSRDVAILAGGSGLYIKALCEGLDDFPDIAQEIRQDLNALHQNEGIEALQQLLQEKDPSAYEAIDRKNARRLIRALEVCLSTGLPYSSFKRSKPKERPFEIVKIGLKMERKLLYQRIDQRVDSMMEKGLLDEARALFPQRSNNALQTLGYQELFDYFLGKHSLEEAVELIKRNTRRFAKRQMTWFNKDKSIQWFHPSQRNEVSTFLRHKIKDD